MKNSWQLLTILLAVALVILSLKIATTKESVMSTECDAEQIGLELIMTRSSVRSYTSQPVEQEKIDKMLKAGMAAPTSKNSQPWEFVVVTDRDLLETFPTFNPGARMAPEGQLAIIVCGTRERETSPNSWIIDCAAATENILLAAHAMGLGAVWCGAYPNNDSDRVGKMKELLNLPEDVFALNVIVIGYPDSEPVIKDKWRPDRVHYNRY